VSLAGALFDAYLDIFAFEVASLLSG